MMRLTFIVCSVFCLCFSVIAQEEDNENKGFSFGINLGGHFANKKTAVIHSGRAEQTIWGVSHIMSQQLTQQQLNTFFQGQTYQLVELPLESKYNTAVEIGLHLNYAFSNEFSVFADLNSSRVKYEQVITIGVDDPVTSQPNFEQFPILGEEDRFNLNAGVQLSYHYEEGLNAYFSFFGNLNDIELKRNYFVINNIDYNIQHPVNGDFSQRPGGIGYGGGLGTGIKFNLSANVLADFYYNATYAKSYMREDLQPFGTHHSIGIRLLWTTYKNEEETDDDF